MTGFEIRQSAGAGTPNASRSEIAKAWKWRRDALKGFQAFLFKNMLVRWFEYHHVYRPNREMKATGAETGRLWEDVFFKSKDAVQLNGWFFPADTTSPRAHLVLLVFRGNAGNIGDRIDLYRALLAAGVNVFAVDYRGYGRSRGKPGEEGTYLDAQAAYQWLRQKGFAEKNIIAYGESLGGAVVTELCLREQTGGLILQSTFTRIVDIGGEMFPWLPVRWIHTIKYDTLSKLPRLKIPVLIMHSRRDELIGFHHPERNFAAANEPKFFCELNGEHNDSASESPAFGQGIEKFLHFVEERARASTLAVNSSA